MDLNCDLGEGEPFTKTRALMRWITSANVACGGHAGTVRSMEGCTQLAKRFRVRLGAHPGAWDRAGFGRKPIQITSDELELLLLQQVGALERLAKAHGVRLHHIKLHGGLYHACENHDRLARRYIEVVRRWWPRATIYARAGGLVAAAARRRTVKVWEEVYADRGYRSDGTLVPRGERGALIMNPSAVRTRVGEIVERSRIETASGEWLSVCPNTICIHSDTPNAVTLAKAIRRLILAPTLPS